MPARQRVSMPARQRVFMPARFTIFSISDHSIFGTAWKSLRGGVETASYVLIKAAARDLAADFGDHLFEHRRGISRELFGGVFGGGDDGKIGQPARQP